MNVVATVSEDEAREIVDLLRQVQIPSQTEATTEETGLEVTGVLVDEAHFDQACDVIEQWAAARAAASGRPAKPRCPACGEEGLERADEVDCLKTITKIAAIYHCPNCGHVVATA
ncbi:MAG: hypothetical protein K8T26_18400 [Lentisphaerae bacterium]|nr:hypothetical protein [Lentisphaerota bacterium]